MTEAEELKKNPWRFSQHRICPSRQSPEEIERNRRQRTAKARVSQDVKSGNKCHNMERHNVENDCGDQAETHEQRRRSRITPARQRLQPLPLRHQDTKTLTTAWILLVILLNRLYC
ncbi:hypothetical protein Nepgr_031206 [Nepenthes gracilis]|uniref:Uncharacterized protein n=1 Tax=Nepenthes gracilis TaxID=150966 RepID=A0AAD3TI14_NEPGR|nr:hypothetical protein Nepgr_031206 [Nepenthes gracilis]